MGPKRSPDGDLDQTSKIPRPDQGAKLPLTPLSRASDFSGSVKKKLANSTRTGQACDRCKVRKIRCDGRPEGCSPCAQNRTECRTTDRITGKATTRGHAEALEGEINYLRAHIVELQNQVRELGGEPRSGPSYGAYNTLQVSWQAPPPANEAQSWPNPSQSRASTSPLPGYAPANEVGVIDYRPLPEFKMQSVGDNYLGLSCVDSMVSHIKGTSLKLFGTDIDITDFVHADDQDYEESVMSYSHFLKVAMSQEEVEYVPFPEYPALSEFAKWYLRSLNPYTMLLDKPSFMQLIWRIGNEPDFRPSPAETVCVHMMLSTIKYQIAVRNGGEQTMLLESHKHYRYSLSLFKDLQQGHTWKDLQGLALICLHMRNFPKPGAAWIAVSTVFLLAVELGMHRSTKAWAGSAEKDQLEIEMRKHIFWTLHALLSNLSGKLGRPMPINTQDIDVEFPDPVNDCLPGEGADLSPFHQCSFQVGIQTAKYTAWASELYRTVYAIRQTPHGYEEAVRRLEIGIRDWRQNIPAEISEPSRASQDDYIFALYLEHWDQEFQLLLHHPAVCRSTNQEMIKSNSDKCLAATQKMLHNCNEMRKLKCLDIPWVNTVVYIAAISVTLFVYFERKDTLTSADMTKLREDMDQWLDVMKDCGELHGTGIKLRQAIEKVVVQQLRSINDSIVKRTATESLAHVALQIPQEQAATIYPNSDGYNQYPDANANPADPALGTSGLPYTSGPPEVSYPYNNGASSTTTQQAADSFEQPQFSGEDASMSASHAAALAAAASSAAASQRPNEGYAYSNAPGTSSSHPAPYPPNSGVTPTGWRNWQKTYMQQIGPTEGEYLNTANTLMTLGTASQENQVAGQEGTSDVDSSAIQGQASFQWPAIMYGPPDGGHVTQ
ncbi:hypothetical protein BU24DRAFT_59728 [Aaosphaeria arxii CBS 175.79]|uniref:Zn(2)-C6 fungal-type domain-containing protein n=1 Tax=Aaosphaeria arxii CBS 175.79 TaxID=1450172 RepID=A0A6A5XC53_9PLEO|nr:uncharacterized protein BU24DRAFT_59728 [Aaosphaeria arxii CBS 175.79]KAF2010538.1 hypothetical protein BU24DRAFT_59728 [Aaosphaeria arxii CBS 175.79]